MYAQVSSIFLTAQIREEPNRVLFILEKIFLVNSIPYTAFPFNLMYFLDKNFIAKKL